MTYMNLSFLVVAMNTGPVVRRRQMSRTIPSRVPTPATVPMLRAMKWYMSSVMPAASVQEEGMSRPMRWPARTARIPKWNSGEAMRRIRDS